MAGHRWKRGGATDREEERELRAEVERLTQEVMRLRLERQRPVGIGSIAEQLAGLCADTAGNPTASARGNTGTDELEAQDQAHHVLAQAESMRRSLLDVLDQLVVAASQMQRQLVAGGSPMEIDRRVLERRRGTDRAPGTAEPHEAEPHDAEPHEAEPHEAGASAPRPRTGAAPVADGARR
ncbi:hypothetical protein MO973_09895 [Paenibacillus sp. TRM 82003]|uniref:hypothetical protein n=1 Tax=Kineococcus sp. TRM81007 TaxID=2925831 RepID=UPI001F57BF87|nr:hypothetical protein [Kineococcus sp. TRM81007]MCI2238160.1 hypothetical protein [Kineococcus sp. TRM81007]MCI3920544.1 hypothetical protein [Paenibacillus sp. TRM 82003]